MRLDVAHRRRDYHHVERRAEDEGLLADGFQPVRQHHRLEVGAAPEGIRPDSGDTTIDNHVFDIGIVLESRLADCHDVNIVDRAADMNYRGEFRATTGYDVGVFRQRPTIVYAIHGHVVGSVAYGVLELWHTFGAVVDVTLYYLFSSIDMKKNLLKMKIIY